MDPQDPTKITGIIDWESAIVKPAFVFAAETPDFAAELPGDNAVSQRLDGTEAPDSAYARLRADVDSCVRLWLLTPMICDKLERHLSQTTLSSSF